jgi:hypothetical protein
MEAKRNLYKGKCERGFLEGQVVYGRIISKGTFKK